MNCPRISWLRRNILEAGACGLFSRGAVNLCTEPVTFNPVDGDCVRPLDQYYPGGNPAFGSVDYKK